MGDLVSTDCKADGWPFPSSRDFMPFVLLDEYNIPLPYQKLFTFDLPKPHSLDYVPPFIPIVVMVKAISFTRKLRD